MSAQLPPFLRPGATRAEIELLLPQCSLVELQAMLQPIQRRLGSSEEIPGDVECAQRIVHQINNVLTALQAEDVLRELDALDRLDGTTDANAC